MKKPMLLLLVLLLAASAGLAIWGRREEAQSVVGDAAGPAVTLWAMPVATPTDMPSATPEALD